MAKFWEFNVRIASKPEHRQVVFLDSATLLEVKAHKEQSQSTSLSMACYELIKLGLIKPKEIEARGTNNA